MPETEILQQRDVTYNETAALAKETEEALLYKNMQTDIVQQLLRRLWLRLASMMRTIPAR